MLTRIRALAFLLALFATPVALAADDTLSNVLDIDATVTSDVIPDLAVITMTVVREGPDVPALTADVNRVLARAFADAKAVPAVTASSGGYSTNPHYENRGVSSGSTRSGWEVRAQIFLKSKDVDALGGLAGRLAQSMQIAGTSFEISPDLRAKTNAALLDQGARAFQDKATAATKAFGFASFTIRRVTVGNAGQSVGPRPMMRMAAADSAAVSQVPLEAGPATLALTITGSLQMRR